MDEATVKTLEPLVDLGVRLVGSGIEIFGVLIIVIGIAWSTFRQLRRQISAQDSEVYKIRIGRSLLLGLPVRAMYLALLEWHRAAELSADRAAALIMADPLQPCRVLMALAGGSAPGMNFDAFLQQCADYDSEDDGGSVRSHHRRG